MQLMLGILFGVVTAAEAVELFLSGSLLGVAVYTASKTGKQPKEPRYPRKK